MANETFMDDYVANPINIPIQIAMCVLVLCIYVLGVFLNTKIIIVSKKDKHATWKIDIFNSSMLMVHYAHVIVMYGVTYLVKDLYLYTGTWFCYTSKAITIYGNAHSTGHSFMTSVLKYVIIVHWERARELGEKKVKQIFLWLNIIYPLYILAMFNLGRPDFLYVYDGISQANRCLGKSDMVSSQDHDKSATKLHNICEIEAPLDHISFEYMVYFGRKSICWLHVILAYSNVWNLLEIFIYCRIFLFMRR